MSHKNNVSKSTFQEYVKEKLLIWKLNGKKFNTSNIAFLKYPYLTSVNTAVIRGEHVPRKNKVKAFDLKYQNSLLRI
ncbi:MAG: hypothetical protein KGY50_05265 [Candidatus Thermoplasmatota archaeon]|nr:hypothetical protein [Candidatus Thermoplasmatota archaeon]